MPAKKKEARVALAFPSFYDTLKNHIPSLEKIDAKLIRNTPAMEIVSPYDMIVFSGGEDVNPSHYGERMEFSDSPNSWRDDVEMTIARAAISSGKKLFGICRGIQLLNVACGGSLWQDLSLQSGAPGRHPSTHSLDIFNKHTFLDVIEDIKTVNSMHHQGIKKYGNGIKNLASFRGVSEIIVSSNNKILAVQWHPEFMSNTSKLFDYLVTDWVFDVKKVSDKIDYTMYASASSSRTLEQMLSNPVLNGLEVYGDDGEVEGLVVSHNEMLSGALNIGEFNLESMDGRVYFLPDNGFSTSQSRDSLHTLNELAHSFQTEITHYSSLYAYMEEYRVVLNELRQRCGFRKIYVKKNADIMSDPLSDERAVD